MTYAQAMQKAWFEAAIVRRKAWNGNLDVRRINEAYWLHDDGVFNHEYVYTVADRWADDWEIVT